MRNNPYERFKGSDLILRDELAMDRTVLANERTLLSYIRTGLAFAITGAGTIHFFVSPISLLLGWCTVAFAFVVAALGVWRFRRVAGHISALRKPPVRLAAGSVRQRPNGGTTEPSVGGDAESRAPQA